MCIDILSYKKGKKTLFDSRKIATAVSEGILRDLEGLQHEYVTPEPVLEFVQESYKSSLMKKFVRPGEDTSATEQAAYKKFLELRRDLLEIAPLSADVGPTLRKSPVLNRTLHRMKWLIKRVLGSFDYDEWFSRCRHGKGTSLGVAFVDTSVEAKWGLPLTCTKRVKPLFEEYLKFDGRLRAAIEHSSGQRHWDGWYEIVEGSRACTVPKNSDIDRMIAIEPTLNMFFQQGLMSMMYDRLAAFGFDIGVLPFSHTWIAFVSSITGEYATIDWSSASDCVLVWLVKEVFPPEWFWAIDICRSPKMSLQGEYLELPMLGTMGNATTFPIETLVFWALAEACTMTGNTVLKEFEEVQCSVFGDDCVVPVESVPMFLEVAADLGLRVNLEKSFSSGPFRESCGGDYYRGYDVRPLHLKGPSDETKNGITAMLHVWLNGITEKYIQYFGETAYLYDKQAYSVIFEVARRLGITLHFCPPSLPHDAGFKCPDIARFIACYEIPFNKVSLGKQGTIMYTYLRFKYGGKRHERDDDLRYAELLRKQAVTASFSQWSRQERRLGRYSVGIGLTAHWAVARQFGTYPLNARG